AQAQGVRLQILGDLPAFREQGRNAAVWVDLGERLKDVVVRNLGNRRGGTRGRVEHRRLQRQRQIDRVLLRLRQAVKRQKRGQCAQGARRQQAAAIDHVVRSPNVVSMDRKEVPQRVSTVSLLGHKEIRFL